MIVLAFTIFIGDYSGTITVIIALLVTACFVLSSSKPVRRRNVIPFVALINSELARSRDPETRFRYIIDNMLKERKLSHDEILKIISSFSHQDSTIGILASKMLTEMT